MKTMEERQERALDALLDSYTIEQPDPRLVARILAQAAATPQEPARRRWFAGAGGWSLPPLLPRAAWLAASVVAGLVIGANGGLVPTASGSDDDIFILAQASLDPGTLDTGASDLW